MKNYNLSHVLTGIIFIQFTISSCAVIPRCPNQLLPIIETSINSTPGSEDDYLTTSGFTACHANISNAAKFGGGLNFPGGVEIEIRNIPGTSNLLFLNAGSGTTPPPGTGTSSIFATLPGNGTPLLFFVKGTVTSTTDKSSIIEIATAGATCNEVVLTRKATMVPSGTPPITVSGTSQKVHLEIGSVSHLDDYVTWAPTSCRIRWQNAGSATSTLNVRLQNMPATDRLRFADTSLRANATATNSTLNLALKGDGSWTNFFIAGNYPNTSAIDKDAVIEVIEVAGGALLSREATMVRIRKNANALSTIERDRYLEALKKLDLTYDDYIEFVQTHARDNTGVGGSTIGWRQAHRGSGFLPWHRAYVLHFERLMQAVDPAVALHYWKFDANAPNIFSQNFMGSNNTAASDMVVLASTNPIVTWTLPGEGVLTGIQRKTPYGDNGRPNVATETATLALGGTDTATSSFGDHVSGTATVAGFKTMEGNPHDPSHAGSGQNSWIGPDPALAVRDPLFFFLHSNVDRLWAKWQWMRNRYLMNDIRSYDLQGSHTTPAAGVAAPAWTVICPPGQQCQLTANRTLGHYAEDTMWPWDNVLSTYSTAAQTNATMNSTSGRPNISVLKPFPLVLGGLLPGSIPRVNSMIDYLNRSGLPGFHQGFAYDDFFPY